MQHAWLMRRVMRVQECPQNQNCNIEIESALCDWVVTFHAVEQQRAALHRPLCAKLLSCTAGSRHTSNNAAFHRPQERKHAAAAARRSAARQHGTPSLLPRPAAAQQRSSRLEGAAKRMAARQQSRPGDRGDSCSSQADVGPHRALLPRAQPVAYGG